LKVPIFFLISAYFFEASQRINENCSLKSKIATPKDPKVFRRDPSLRCAMKAGSLELSTLGAIKSCQGKYEERKEREKGVMEDLQA
jgi:hypothetical protein